MQTPTAPVPPSRFEQPPSVLPATTETREAFGYRLKCALLGPPLISADLGNEKLSKKLALGVLSSDCISSAAYGSEEMLLVLIPLFGLSAYTLLLPLTGVVLVVLVLVTLTYRWVVTTYTQAGGSYVVARENFGPVVAQVGAVALMLDYIVTVAVQVAAGTAAVTSAVPALTSYQLEISVVVVLVLAFGNLRGLREAGRVFAFPTYFFVASVGLVIVGGIVREVLGDLPHFDPSAATASGGFPVGGGSPLLSIGGAYILLRAFANGGSSLTGLEAISNGVSAFERPQGLNARRTLVTMSIMLGSLVAGVSWLAHETHAVPYVSGSPTVISQVAQAVLGDSLVGHLLFLVVQFSTMLILWTGANTPFNGFPFLANFVAGDGYLPRWLTKRGHRLAFSNGIIVLATLALILMVGTGAHVDKLVAFYAIGVFTGFTLAGFGMARHFLRRRGRSWRLVSATNAVVGGVAALVVLIFAVTKFTEGAWLVVVLFPILVVVLLRLRAVYTREEEILDTLPSRPGTRPVRRSSILVLVDNVDLATLRALEYARSLRPDSLRVVHFVIDTQHADRLRRSWDALGLPLGLELIDCPDRRLPRAALELAERTRLQPTDPRVTVLLPRRQYGVLVGRFLHDRTADSIAQAVSQLRGVAATIVPFDATVRARPASTSAPAEASTLPVSDAAAQQPLPAPSTAPSTAPSSAPSSAPRPAARPRPRDPATGEPVSAVATLRPREAAVVEGRIRAVETSAISSNPALRAELVDETGGVTLLFYGRRWIDGLEPGTRVRVRGRLGSHRGEMCLANPSYELLPETGGPVVAEDGREDAVRSG